MATLVDAVLKRVCGVDPLDGIFSGVGPVRHVSEVRAEVFAQLVTHPSRPAREVSRALAIEVPELLFDIEVIELLRIRADPCETGHDTLELLAAALRAGGLVDRLNGAKEHFDTLIAATTVVLINGHCEKSVVMAGAAGQYIGRSDPRRSA